jgi:hypothetical protein
MTPAWGWAQSRGEPVSPALSDSSFRYSMLLRFGDNMTSAKTITIMAASRFC